MDFAEVIGEASNGEDAVSLYKNLKPDLVTMDLVMPNYDGLQAIEKRAKDYIKKPFKDNGVYTEK
jgi:two-component system chemotaxis response regulator CheY